AVQIAYGVEVPLPKTFNRDMDITLEGMFAWEREICRRALALDVRNPSSSSMVELLRLLNAIWEIGYFHVAKRVVVGVMADMMHLGPCTSTLDFVQNTVLPSFHESGMNPTNLLPVLASLAIHLNIIPGVKKVDATEIVCKKTVQKGAEHTPTTPHSESTHVIGPDCEIGTGAGNYRFCFALYRRIYTIIFTASAIEKTVQKGAEQSPTTPPSEPTHFELEMPPAELPYPDESTDIDPASVPATRSCSIL
ncbi:hypothetical protein PRIPAC_76483, partial [Pristionchus pacificus]|uniref:Uncharacterized protein n=1 Tax=Pristionchus pacificus TaxID=54126 RepID=A0A2A6C570_PRIPA